MTTDSVNPLLDLEFEIPFDQIQPQHVAPAVTRLLAEARAALERIEQDEAPRSYQSVLAALEEATRRLEIATTVVGHLESVANTPELREAYNAVRPEVSAFYAGIPLREALWTALQEFSKTTEAQQLTGTRARHLQLTLDEFRRSGAQLGQDGKDRLEAISRKLAELTNKFGQNVLDETAAFELVLESEDQVRGLPQSALDAARADADAKGKAGWRFTLQAPSLIPILTHLDDRNTREQVWRAYNRRAAVGARSNEQLTLQILELRQEQATLLGYDNFAEMVLEDRMAKHAATAKSFVQDLSHRTTAFFEAETKAIAEFALSYGPNPVEVLQPWDVGYYSEKQRQALYDFDEEQLRPFFRVDRVMEGLFEIADRLYGVKVSVNKDFPSWHKSVQAYDIRDESGSLLASFFADLFPREEKRGGAWMNSLVCGVQQETQLLPHLGLICANVTPPIGDAVACLTHSEVTTLFHEFGHLLHQCLSRVEVRSLAGANVAWDFVELPSQILENWCWEREALDTFARDAAGNRIPEELFAKMTRARTFRAASAMMRQLGFAAVDLALHVDYQPEVDGALFPYARERMQPYSPAPYPADYAMIASFGHLFSSAVAYAAGYYSYKWAEVLDADAFTRFKREGIFSRETGLAFRSAILERGNTADPMELYQAFMGRGPSLDALMDRSGLIDGALPTAAS